MPALVSLADTLIEVVDANGKRPLAPQATASESGGVKLSFTDRLEAGAENHYRLSIRFSQASQADLQIHATLADEGGEATIRSTTFFHIENAEVKPRGTFQGSKALKAKPTASVEGKFIRR